MTVSEKYNRKDLEHLWKLNYEDLALAPSDENVGMTEVRFVMQAKVAWETQRYVRITTAATVVMAIATFVQAIGAFLEILKIIR